MELEVLKQNLESIDNRFLKQLRESAEPLDNYPTPESFHTMETTDRQTVEESIEKNYQQIRSELAEELLQQIGENTPRFFEELVIDLLVKWDMGVHEKTLKLLGEVVMAGIDGVINEDRLGLDVIYVQAKRWEANVSRPELQKFAGALQGHERGRESSLQHQVFREMPASTSTTLTPKLCSLTGANLRSL